MRLICNSDAEYFDFFHVLLLLLLLKQIYPLLKSIYSKNRLIHHRYLTIIDTTTKHRVLCIIKQRTCLRALHHFFSNGQQ